MKIAFLSRYQNRINRGAETYVEELSNRLRKHHQIDILIGRDADSFSKIISGHYNIVFSINGRWQSLKASLGRLFGKYKLFIPGESGIGMDSIWNTLVVKPDVFIALTDYMASWIKKWTWGSKIVKIPNGVDLNKFNLQGKKIDLGLKKPLVLSVGALTWYKHHEKTIDAVSRLKDCSLVIIGEGKDKEPLAQLADRKLKNRYKILSVSYKQLPEIYRSADIFCLPSWEREAFGIVYLEAMASGLGIVAPDDPVRREIVGEAGILIDVDDSQMYSAAIRKALDTDWIRKARMQAEKFSWDKIADQYETILRNLR